MPDLRMPQLALGDEEVKVVKWLKELGDPVALGEPVLEVETDKATMDVEAPVAGFLTAASCQEGDMVAAGVVIGYIGATADDGAAQAAPAAVGAGAAAAAPPASTPAQTPPARGAGNGAPPARSAAPPPLVEHGELAGLPTGGRKAATRPAAVPAAAAAAAPAPTPAGTFRERPLSRRRTAIARRMLAAAAIPQFAIKRDIPVDGALAALERLKAAGGKASMSDVILRAAAEAAREHPGCNAWFVDDKVREFEAANISFAVDTPEGVVAPVIRGSEALSFPELARRRAELVLRAQENRLGLEDLSDGTFTVSNVGPLAADEVVPVITPPQVAALGTGRVRTHDGQRVITATFVADHRALDGADGARYLASLAAAIERTGEALA